MTIRTATRKSFERLAAVPGHHPLCDEALERLEALPIDKLSRWLGYCQAYAVFHNLTTVKAERDATRPWFHEAYKSEKIAIPPTRNP